MANKKFILFTYIFFSITQIFSQEIIISKPGVEFSVKVKIVDENNVTISNKINIYINGKNFNIPDVNGNYLIRGKVDDEIRVTHPDFDTVFYRLKSNEDIKVVVKGYSINKSYSKKRKKNKTDLNYLDSAKYYKNLNIDKSIYFIEKALSQKRSRNNNANIYKTLADVYFYWEQYDLAEYNYKLSNQIKKDLDSKIAIAKSQFLQQKYEDSENNYKEILNFRPNDLQKISVFEGLGDIYYSKKEFLKSKDNYQKALDVATENSILSKKTDLNSKIAKIYAEQGKINEAEQLYKKSISLASKESKKRALEEEEKVADFYNSNRRFDDEIKIRKQSLEQTKNSYSVNSSIRNEDSITSQKINYKIGSAYILKEEYDEAISYLEKSKEDANKKNDFEIEKDATRKISEVYASLGEYDKALKNYREYVKLVDELYVKKEQEIQQVKRFSKKIADNQNRILSLEKDKELAESKISLAYVDQKLSEESNRKQQILIYSLFGGIILLCLLAYSMKKTNKQQKLANNLLALKSMRSQMNPHFIFNALNSVNSFIAVNDERSANRYLSEFSTLMRSVLENSDEDFISLTKEIELLELYVKLEYNRFKDKFDYKINIDKNLNLEDFEIPPMLLQPYIENAIWHGLRYRKEKGFLKIDLIKIDDFTVKILIVDNGIGREKSNQFKTKNQLKQKSKGMSTVKNRISILNDMYKEKILVNVSDMYENGEGTKVEVIVKK